MATQGAAHHFIVVVRKLLKYLPKRKLKKKKSQLAQIMSTGRSTGNKLCLRVAPVSWLRNVEAPTPLMVICIQRLILPSEGGCPNTVIGRGVVGQ